MKIGKLQISKAQKLGGWMSDLELFFLAELAYECEVIFEVGSFQGKSARVMADNSKAKIYCIDPWGVHNYNDRGIVFTTDSSTFSLFYANLYAYIKAKKVIPCQVKFEDYEPVEKADLIFLDGDHRYSAIKHDIIKAKKWIRPGGVIAGHDYHQEWPGVFRAVDEEFPKFELVDTLWSAHV
jgi:hypothetical protein